MARKKVGVTLDNMFGVWSYFERLINNAEPIRFFSENNENIYDARNSLKLLPEVHHKNNSIRETSTEIRRKALQTWVNMFVSDKQWNRCLKTLRHNKSRRTHKSHRIELPHDVFIILKSLSKNLNLTFGETIRTITKPELEKINQKEIKNIIDNDIELLE